MSDKQYYKLSELELRWIKSLGGCTFGCGSPDKRFVRDSQGVREMTASQLCYVARLVWRYRRQLGLGTQAALSAQKELADGIEARGVVIDRARCAPVATDSQSAQATVVIAEKLIEKLQDDLFGGKA